MNLVSKLTLFPCIALLAGMILSGCGSTAQPDLSDNPTAPAMIGAGTGPVSGTTNSASATGTLTNDLSSSDLGSIPNGAPRFQNGETVTISTSTGSDLYPGPIPTSQPYNIADDGTITLPLIGTVQAAARTPGELQDEIEERYVPQYYVRLAVTVTAPNRVYYVGGEVVHPGPEEYLGQTTVTKAIQSAGDFTQFAKHVVWLTRADGTRIRVNVDKALRDSTDDPPVYPGDQIQVPRRYF